MGRKSREAIQVAKQICKAKIANYKKQGRKKEVFIYSNIFEMLISIEHGNVEALQEWLNNC